MKKNNETMIQYFEWYLPKDCKLWKRLQKEAKDLRKMGITSIWLPPAQKGAGGTNDTGYGVYDLYDLGEFNQKGTVRTKYGTKEEYLAAIKALQAENIQVLADIVLNHRLGGDEPQDIIACKVDPENRTQPISDYHMIRAWTKFNFEGRNNTYSDFKLNWSHFTAIDYDEKTDDHSIHRFYGKHFSKEVDKEHGNYDYLMGCDVDFNNVDVVDDLIQWGKWFYETTHVNGFRLDAIKHIRSSFYKRWLFELKKAYGTDLYTVGEYFSGDVNLLINYLEYNKQVDSLFDVPLHYHFLDASQKFGHYDMRKIFDDTLVSKWPSKAVTFVDNHDTEPGQSLESWIPKWFKYIAYAIIMLREKGIPCIFYGDYFGIPFVNFESMKDYLDVLLLARKHLAYGKQTDYMHNEDIIGWTREGDYYHQDSGMAVVVSDGPGGHLQMNVGKNLADTVLYDCTRKR